MIERYNLDRAGSFKSLDGYWCHWSDIEPLLKERDELLRKLKVYEEGKPNDIGLKQAEQCLSLDGLYSESRWLRRIAAMGDVAALGSAGSEMGEVK